jgi:hypothetical protein
VLRTQIIPLLGKTLLFISVLRHFPVPLVLPSRTGIKPTARLLHSIIDGVHSERTYKFQLIAYDLPTVVPKFGKALFSYIARFHNMLRL